MRYILLLVVMVCATAHATGAAVQDWESLTPDGTLAGWRILSGEWRIEDGVIIGKAAKGENCWMIYEAREFSDFEVEFEFRTQTPTNGGLQFRSHWLPRMPIASGESAEQAPRLMYGYQANVETRLRTATGRLIDENGRGPLVEEAAKDAVATLRQRDWNRMRVAARGPKIEIYLHDVLAASYEDEAFIRGFLALQAFAWQSEGDFVEVEYRNLRVKDYGRDGNWRALFDGATLNGWKEWGEEEWNVQDGVIYGKSGPKRSEGYLATLETFKDFRVRGGFKMLGAGNYGLFYHSTIHLRDDGYPVIAGLQGEVEPGFPGSSGWIFESYQRGWLVQPDPNVLPAVALRPGAWNEIEIRTRGSHVTTWVNGIRVLNFEDGDQRLFEGSFALQLHEAGADGIAWKDLYVEGDATGAVQQ